MFCFLKNVCTFAVRYAEVAQLVERNLAKVEVASSNLVFRSKIPALYNIGIFCLKEVPCCTNGGGITDASVVE